MPTADEKVRAHLLRGGSTRKINRNREGKSAAGGGNAATLHFEERVFCVSFTVIR
jgi:hypothetical protein